MVTPTASMIKMSMINMILRTIIDKTHCSCHDVVVFLAVSARRSRAVGQSHGKDGGGGLGSRTQLQIEGLFSSMMSGFSGFGGSWLLSSLNSGRASQTCNL